MAGDSDTFGNCGLAIGGWTLGVVSNVGVESIGGWSLVVASSVGVESGTGLTAVMEGDVGTSVGYVNFVTS